MLIRRRVIYRFVLPHNSYMFFIHDCFELHDGHFQEYPGSRVKGAFHGSCFDTNIVRAEYASGTLPIVLDTIVPMVRLLYVHTNTYVHISHRVAIIFAYTLILRTSFIITSR